MKILFIGDIFGSPGRRIIEEKLDLIKKKLNIDLVIANAENSTHGKGITPKHYFQLIKSGINYITMGNHTWSKKEIVNVLKKDNIVRPANLSSNYHYSNIGVGSLVFEWKNLTFRLTNLLGSTINFWNNQTNPFIYLKDLIAREAKVDFHFVDLHAETTSEKIAFFHAFNGQIQCLIGTHTHVQSNDYFISNEGTAFITDVGMTGPIEGIIGGDKEIIIDKFFDPQKIFLLKVAKGARQLSSVLIEIDEINKKIIDFYPVNIREKFKPKTLPLLFEA